MCNLCKCVYDVRNLMREKLYILEICMNLAIISSLIHLKIDWTGYLERHRREQQPLNFSVTDFLRALKCIN